MIGLNATPQVIEGSSDHTPRAPSVVCREILASDTNGVIKLLTRGFKEARDRDFWINAFRRMKNHRVPPEYPRYGYFLESGGVPVGVILLIFTLIDTGDSAAHIQCSVSSWYVDPRYRAYGTLLIACALKHKHVTYYNVTPAPHTWNILTAQGYRRFSEGRVVAVPAFSLTGRAVSVEIFSDSMTTGGLSDFEVQLLQSHMAYGCVSVVCSVGGKKIPFVFSVRRRLKIIQFGFLIYCRDIESFVRCSGAIGRYLALRGIPLVILDADKPVPGLFGRFSNRNPKYFKGPNQPRLGDLAYSDRAMFGV